MPLEVGCGARQRMQNIHIWQHGNTWLYVLTHNTTRTQTGLAGSDVSSQTRTDKHQRLKARFIPHLLQ